MPEGPKTQISPSIHTQNTVAFRGLKGIIQGPGPEHVAFERWQERQFLPRERSGPANCRRPAPSPSRGRGTVTGRGSGAQ